MGQGKPLSSYKALAYDIIGEYLHPGAGTVASSAASVAHARGRCAGTLIDYEVGVLAFLRQRVDAAGQQRSDNEILESYARNEQQQQVRARTASDFAASSASLLQMPHPFAAALDGTGRHAAKRDADHALESAGQAAQAAAGPP